MSNAVRAITCENRGYAATRAMNTDTEGAFNLKMWIGSGDIKEIQLAYNGWYLGTTSIINIPNAIQILDLYINDGTTSVQILKGGLGTFAINPGDNDVRCDAISIQSAFGVEKWNRDGFFWVKGRFSVAATSMAVPFPIRAVAQNANQQAIYYNPANTTPSASSAVGVFTTTGSAPTASTGTIVPICLGKFFDAEDPHVWAGAGDSILESVNDAQSSTPGGIGIFQRALWNGGVNVKAGINMAKSGSLAQPYYNAAGDVISYWSQFCDQQLFEHGTNNFETSGNLITAAQMSDIDELCFAKAKSRGISKILRTKLGPRTSSTDSYATEANQTVTGSGWDVGGNVETFNNGLAAKVTSGTINRVCEMNAWRGTNPKKWISDGVANKFTADGAHPQSNLTTLLAAEVRADMDFLDAQVAPIIVTSGVEPMSVTWNPTGADVAQLDKNRTFLTTGNLTLVAADSGKAYVVKSGTSIFTLPATAPGLVYTFQFQGLNGGGQIQVSPVAADGIGAAGSAVVNKDLILASATIKKGDFVKIISGVGATGVTAWHLVEQRGIVTKEA